MFDVEPFTTRDALKAGVTPAQLRAKRWMAPFSGVRMALSEQRVAADQSRAGDPSPAAGRRPTAERGPAARKGSAVEEGLVANCLALQTVVRRHAVVSGSTAARLYGWWLPPGLDGRPIEITVPPGTVVDRPGVRARRRIVGAAELSRAQGVLLTSPARTLTDLAGQLPLVDLVVMMDAALHMRHCSRKTLEALAEYRDVPGARGIRNFRRALQLAHHLSESPMETLMRLVIVLSDQPPPLPQARVFDDFGNQLARVDLKAPGTNAVFEYDGAEHGKPSRHAKDVARWRTLRAAGFEVYPYTAKELFGTPHCIVADYRSALNLPPDILAVQGWLREFRRSSFSRRSSWPPD